MKKWLWILAIVFAAVAAFGQTDNTLYARNFPGSTVGVKVTNAQNACNADTSIPCIIVIDPTLAAYPTGTMPTKCANCIWWDYRTVNGGLQVNSVASGQGLNCNPTTGSVVCALNAILPNGEEGITQPAGDASQRLATDAFVSNQISAVSASSYGEASAAAAANENTVTLGSTPILGTVSLWQNDVLVPPQDYSESGTTITLNGYTFSTGAQISVYWQSAASAAGGITLSSVNIGTATIRQTISASDVSGPSSGDFFLPLPPETQAGDMVIAIVDSTNNVGLYSTPQNGFALVNFTPQAYAGDAEYKVVTQSDLTQGNINFGYILGGGGTYSYTVIDFGGATGGIREADANYSANSTSGSVSTSSAVIAGDAIIGIAGSADIGTGTATISGTQVANVTAAPTAVSYTVAQSAGVQTLNYSFNYTPFYGHGELIVVEAGTSLQLGVEPANYVYAGPASGSAGLPAWRQLTKADLPVANDISTTPDTATPSTFPAIQSVQAAGCTTGANSYDSCDVTMTWPKPFADTTYQVSCTADTPSVTQTGCTGTSGCQMGTIAGDTKTATTVTVIWETTGANAATATNFNCIAMQNVGQ